MLSWLINCSGNTGRYAGNDIARAVGGLVTAVVVSVAGLTGSSGAVAGEADVLKAVATLSGEHYRFDVTIRSNDKGWDYYCDRFEIVSEDGKVLGTRVLYHPHETEQPFTRSLGQVSIPPGINSVMVRASMKPGGEGGDTVTIALPGR